MSENTKFKWPTDSLPVEQSSFQWPSGAAPAGDSDFQWSADSVPVDSAEAATLKDMNLIKPDEVERIARKHGVDADKLKANATWYAGAYVGTPEAPPPLGKADAQKVAYLASDAAFGVPHLIYKKMQEPNERRALDELRSLADERKSLAVQAGEIAGSIGLGLASAGGAFKAIKAAEKAGKRTSAAKAVLSSQVTAIGGAGVYGASTSEEGNEAAGALTMGGVAAALLGLGGAGAKGIALIKKLAGPAEAEAVAGKAAHNLVQDVEAELAKRAPEIDSGFKRVEEFAESGNAVKKAEVETLARKLEETPAELERLKKVFPDAKSVDDIAAAKAVDEAEHHLQDFARFIKSGGKIEDETLPSFDESKEIIQKFVRTNNPVDVKKEYSVFRASKIAQDLNADFLAKGGGVTDSKVQKLSRAIIDNRPYGKIIDARNGTTLEKWFDEASTARNKYTSDLATVVKQTKPLLSKLDNLKLTPDQLIALEKQGPNAIADAATRKVIEDYGATFERLRQHANELGVPVKRIGSHKAAFYIPAMRVKNHEAVARTLGKLNRAAQKAGVKLDQKLSENAYQQLLRSGGEELKDGLAGVKALLDKVPESANDLIAHMTLLRDPDQIAKVAADRLARLKASAALARGEETVPTFLRETNLSKLLIRWSENTLRQAYLGKSIRELVLQRNLLASVKDMPGVHFVDNLLADIKGTRRDTLASEGAKFAERWRTNALLAFDKLPPGSSERLLAQMIINAPDMGMAVLRSVYPNFLGASIKAVVQNLTQPFLVTMPELAAGGVGYASWTVLRAYMSAMRELASPGRKRMRSAGHVGSQYTNELADVLRVEMSKHLLYKVPADALNTLSKAAMSLFEVAEWWNRVLGAQVGQIVAKDLVAGKESAKAIVKQMGKGYQLRTNQLLSKPEKLAESMEQYFIGKTIFNYDKMNMSAFGRWAGPIFSTFTKWPTMVLGDIASDFVTKKSTDAMSGTLRKYFAPYVGAMLLMQYFPALNPKENAYARILTGKEGLAGAAPIKALSGLADRGLFVPPPVEIAAQAIKALLNLDAYEAYRASSTALSAYMPGAFIIRSLSEAKGLWEEKPQTGTFYQKSAALAGDERMDERVRRTLPRTEN